MIERAKTWWVKRRSKNSIDVSKMKLGDRCAGFYGELTARAAKKGVEPEDLSLREMDKIARRFRFKDASEAAMYQDWLNTRREVLEEIKSRQS